MESKLFFQQCPASIVAIAGAGKNTTAAMLEAIFQAYFSTTGLTDQVHLVGAAADPRLRIRRDLDTQSDISNIDLVLYILSDDQLAHLAVNLQYLIIGPTTDQATGVAAVKATNLHTKQVFYLGRDLNSYALANRTLAPTKLAYPDDLPFHLPHLQVVGDWQHECAAAAALVASRFDLPTALISTTLASFNELPHHLDLIREVKDVKYYDDGVSTSPELAEVSIKTFDQPIVISTTLFPPELVKRQIIIPVIRPTEGIGSTPATVGAPLIDRADTLTDATQLASIFAVPGDTVLYVPAVPGLSSAEFVLEVNRL